jgi:hypothetical protein
MQSQVYEARLAHARILRRAPDRGTRLIDGYNIRGFAAAAHQCQPPSRFSTQVF